MSQFTHLVVRGFSLAVVISGLTISSAAAADGGCPRESEIRNSILGPPPTNAGWQ